MLLSRITLYLVIQVHRLFNPYMTSKSLTSPSSRLDTLPKNEVFWRNKFTWFKDQCYQLCPHFAPDWIPSWKGTSKTRLQCENGYPLLVSFLWNTHCNILIFIFPVPCSSHSWAIFSPFSNPFSTHFCVFRLPNLALATTASHRQAHILRWKCCTYLLPAWRTSSLKLQLWSSS